MEEQREFNTSKNTLIVAFQVVFNASLIPCLIPRHYFLSFSLKRI